MSFKLINWKDDKKYSLVSGGLIYTIMMKFNFISKSKDVLRYKAILFSAVAWLPLLLLSIVEGTFIGDKVDITFLEDFRIHTRLLIVIPFLILVEKLIEPAYNTYVNKTRRTVTTEEEKIFDSITRKIDRLSNSFIPEIIFLIAIYGAIFLIGSDIDSSITKWDYFTEGNLTITGWMYVIVGFPLYQLLIARWLWRWIIWFYSVIKFSRLDLKIFAMHADKMAGLGYLNTVPVTFGVLCLSISLVFSATIGMEVIYYNAVLKDYHYLVLGFVIAIPLILFMPLLFFIPALFKAKTKSTNYFGSLIQYHNHLFTEKWMEGKLTEDETILGSVDNSSLADINGAYQQSVSDMNVFPIKIRMILAVAMILLIPFLPLLLFLYSLRELISKFYGIMFG